MSGIGKLTIAPVMLGRVLRLPAGQEVVGAEFDHMGNLELTIEGNGMPNDDGGPVRRVTIIFEQHSDGRLTAHWQHDPRRQWTIIG